MRSLFVAVALTTLFVAASPGFAAPEPAKAAGASRVLKVSGTVELVEDGEIVLALELTAEQVARTAKLPGVERGIPDTAGRIGVQKDTLYARYLLAPGPELDRQARSLLHRKVALELDGQERRVRVIRVR